MNRVKLLRENLVTHRQRTGNKRGLPKGFWDEVLSLAKNIPANDLAKELGIDLLNLKRRLKGNNNRKNFVELPSSPLSNINGQTRIEFTLPNGIQIRILS